MAQIDYIADWASRLRSRLYTQFRGKAGWTKWTDAVLGPQFQALEDAWQTILTILDIDGSSGLQLDTIGKIAGQPRGGVDDPSYRLYLKARILANRSTGTPEDLFSLYTAMLGVSALPTYKAGWNKQFAIKLGAVITRAQALIGVSFLTEAKETGARGILEWQEYADSLMFEFASDHATVSSTTTSGLIGGATTACPLASATSFPNSGRVYISGSNNEYIRYTSKAGNTLTLANAVTLGHSAGDTVEVIYGDGLGFDDGYFAGAAQA